MQPLDSPPSTALAESPFAGITERIHKTYTENDAKLQESVVEECMQYFLSITDNDIHSAHIFCTSTESATVVSFLIVVLAGFDVNFNNDQFTSIRTCIDNCTDCLLHYHQQRAIIRQNFITLKKVPYRSIQLTMEKPALWEANHLYDKISQSIENKLDNESLKLLLSKILAECLLNPKMLRIHKKLKTYFDHCTSFLNLAHNVLASKNLKIYPGLIYLLFSDNDQQRSWALSKMPYNLNNGDDKVNDTNTDNQDLINYYTTQDLDPLFVEEYEIHFFNIQTPTFFNDERSIQFWTNLTPLLRFSNQDAIRTALCEPYTCSSYRDDVKVRIVPLYSVFVNHIFSYLKTPLPFLLRFLAVSLEKFKQDIFDLIKPHNYMSFFDMAFNNPMYKKLLVELPPDQFPTDLLELDSNRSPYFVDLVKWMEVCSQILNDSNSCQFSIAMFGFMADYIKDGNCGNFIGTYVMENMNNQLTLKNNIYNDKINFELSFKHSARTLIDKKCILLFDAISTRSLEKRAVKLISTSLIFDIDTYAFYSYRLNNNELLNTPDLSIGLWNMLTVKITSNANLLMSVFKAFKDIIKVYLIDVSYKKTKLINDRIVTEDNIKKIILNCNKHNKTILQFTQSVENVLIKLSEYLTNDRMKLILNEKDASLGFWSLILSPIDKIYDSSVALMLESFDVDDRLEAFKECLSLNLIVTLDSFKTSLRHFTSLQLFIPTQRIVKVLMDFTNALFDPMNGIMVSSSTEMTLILKTSIVEFWIDVWGFLGMIFRNIFTWSITYEKLKSTLPKDIADKITSDLLNFTRDVLDLSHLVLNGLKVILSLLNSENYKSEEIKAIKETLVKPIIVTLSDLFKWLRLSDSALLVSCVELITKILDMSTESGIQFKDDLLTILVKLCLRAKKFNNKMNKEQTGELLVRARQMNDRLVEDVSSQVEDEKVAALMKKSGSPEPLKSDYQYTSRKTQPSLSSYLKPYIRENVPSFDAPKRMSKLELAQLKLAEKRKTVEPAPPRPSGFNNKKKPITINSDNESGDDHDHNDSDHEGHGNALFTKEQVVAKMKKTKAALQSLQAPRFHNDLNKAQNDKRNELMKKKQAEEYMRLRLNVDMSPLYKTILSWSYNNDKELPSDYAESKYFPIKDKFDSVDEYRKSFEPLLLLECWQSIQRAKQVGDETPFRMTIGSRSATDSFFDIYASVKKDVISSARCFGDNDLLVIMLVDGLPDEESGMGIPRRLLRNSQFNCFAKVKEIKNANNKYSDITLRVSSENNNLVHKISPRMELVGLKVNTMTTLEREFSSLAGLRYYDLSNEILKAEPDEVEVADEKKIDKLKVLYDVNDSQARAISGTVQGTGFSLIQGPPGTGKTKTILGVIGYFLTQDDGTVHRVLAPGVRSDGSTSINPTSTADDRVKKKILICAPSNAAVDELVLRIRKGIKNSKGQSFKPTVVRLGKSDAINEQVKDLTLEEQVEAQLTKLNNNNDASNSIREEHRKCIVERDELRKQLDSGTLPETEISKVELKLQQVLTKRRELGKRLDEMREQKAVNYRNREIEKRNLQYKILNNAQVVCSTLSGSAHDVLAGMSLTFETVVIDEAAQCIELSAIIPLRYGCKKCIMVGDPNQLPPTVLSQKASSYNYEQSLFVRMQKNFKESVYLLDVQYRMHPQISKFPSKEFYNSRLKDGPDMAVLNKRPWHDIEAYSPYRFFNIKGQQIRNDKTQSLSNKIECRIILEIVEDLYRRFSNVDWSNRIGIISPYKEQVRLLKRTFIDRYGSLITKQVDFNTVDGFQGQEKDIILFSCVRAETHTGVGFLADIRRMNVALTRARASLWVVGSVDALVKNKTWRDLFNDAKDRNLVTEAYIGFTRSLEGGQTPSKPKITEIETITLEGENTKDDGSVIRDAKKSIDNRSQRVVKDSKKRPLPSSDRVDTSQMKKLSKPKNVVPVKKSTGQISRDMKLLKRPTGPSSSGFIMPPQGSNLPPGMIKISGNKNSLPRKPNIPTAPNNFKPRK